MKDLKLKILKARCKEFTLQHYSEVRNIWHGDKEKDVVFFPILFIFTNNNISSCFAGSDQLYFLSLFILLDNEYSGVIWKKVNALSIVIFLRDYLFSITGIFFISFIHDYLCSRKKVIAFFNSENLYLHATTIPFSHFSFLNLIFL